jgi:thiol:disulfide interchange protein DsbC
MKRVYSIIAALALLIVPLGAHAFPAKKGDKACAKCHKLSDKDAQELVKKLAPDAKVTKITMAPIKGIWQIDVEAGEGNRGSLYLGFSKKNIMIGQIIPVESIGKKPPARKVDVSKIPLKDAVTVGAATAKNKVIVFTDPDCPYCRELHKSINQIVEKRKDIAFDLILNPLPMHKDAYKKVQAIICSRSITMLDDAFAGKAVADPPAPCSADAVERNKKLAQTLDFTGTPTLIRNDGTVLSGFLPEEQLIKWIDKKQ